MVAPNSFALATVFSTSSLELASNAINTSVLFYVEKQADQLKFCIDFPFITFFP